MYDKKFIQFINSLKNCNPSIVEAIKEAYKIIFEAEEEKEEIEEKIEPSSEEPVEKSEVSIEKSEEIPAEEPETEEKDEIADDENKKLIDVAMFLKENPNPEDEELHKWAESKGYNVPEVEDAVYELATKYVQFWSGGKSNAEGMTSDKADPKELEMGIEVESEHSDDLFTRKKIAMDHLAEYPDYYTRLKKVED
jgi:hypothetical protein